MPSRSALIDRERRYFSLSLTLTLLSISHLLALFYTKTCPLGIGLPASNFPQCQAETALRSLYSGTINKRSIQEKKVADMKDKVEKIEIEISVNLALIQCFR